jgi:hypothetical protein
MGSNQCIRRRPGVEVELPIEPAEERCVPQQVESSQESADAVQTPQQCLLAPEVTSFGEESMIVDEEGTHG